MADGIAIWEILLLIILLFIQADVIAFFISIGRCYGQWIVADDMPLRLMLLPIVYWFNILADVIAIYCGRCYYHFLSVLFLADVIANVFVADVIATEADVIACNDSFS